MASDEQTTTRAEAHLPRAGAPRWGLYRLFPPATRAELWAGVTLIVVSLLGAGGVVKGRSDALALEQDAVYVEGTVVRRWMTPAKNSWHYHVEYEYPAPSAADPQAFHDTARLSEEYFNRLREGGPIVVAVCRGDPANHQVVGESPCLFASATATLVSLIFLALLALAGVINLWWWSISRVEPRPVVVAVLAAKND